MRGGSRNVGGQMRRKFLRGRPLIESSVGAAPHGNLAVTKRLLREPLDHVVSIAWLLRKRLELAAGIAAPANIDQRKRVTVRREIGGAGVIRVGDIRGKCED